MKAADRETVYYDYDVYGRLWKIRQGTETFEYGYDTLSRVANLQRPNGVTTIFQYDEAHQIQRMKHTNATTTLEDLQYFYNLDGEIKSIISLASAPLVPQSKTANVADAANRITQFGSSSMNFNAEGQTLARIDASGTNGYQWDARGRLKQVTLPNGQAISYDYDALGRRTNRTENGITTTFQYDGADVVIDRASSGTSIDYLNGLGIDDKLRQTGGAFGTLYYLQDHLSSTVALTSAGGNLVEQNQYEAFGASVGSARTRYSYTGRERDESWVSRNLRCGHKI